MSLSAIQHLPLDSVIASTNLTGAIVANLNESPDTPDASWATATLDNEPTIIHVGFQNHTNGPLVAGPGLQSFRAFVRASLSPTGTFPTVLLQLYENGVSTGITSAGLAVNTTVGLIVEFAFDASFLADSSGDDVELRMVSQHGGGAKADRKTVEYNAIEFVGEGGVGEPPRTEVPMTMPAPPANRVIRVVAL